jgi:transcriptional regulator with XRE-family HTH domain
MQHMNRAVPVFTLGDRLRKAREVAGLTQTELANSLGIGRRSVSRYEDGVQMPKRGAVMAWSMATGVPFEWLATGQMSQPDGGGGDNLGVTIRYPADLAVAA